MSSQGPTREQVFQALFALLNNNVTGIANYSRRFTLPTKIDAQDLRVGTATLMVWEQPEKTERPGEVPIRTRTWEAWVVVYFRNDDPSVAGATIINPIIDEIETLIEGSPPAQFGAPVQNLGGLVDGVWIDGTTLKETGDTDEAGLGGCVIRIHILVP
jgi:hypothetical protein